MKFSPLAVCVTVSSAVLCFSSHWMIPTTDAFVISSKSVISSSLTSSSSLSIRRDQYYSKQDELFLWKKNNNKNNNSASWLLSASSTATSEDEGSTVQLKLFNSLSRDKELFVPQCDMEGNNSDDEKEKKKKRVVTMYTCGPTVYDYAHVGNFRAFLTYDVLKRVLTYFQYDVQHICNLTDVDDKIIARCDREGVGLLELTRKFEDLFMADLEALNIIKADKYPRATEHIDEMVQMIQDLEQRGLAYQSQEGSWYFAVNKKQGYGQQLVNLDLNNMKQNASGNAGKQRTNSNSNDNNDIDESAAAEDADEYDADKEGVRDFALWKAYKPKFDRDDATWDTPIGKGRPGWHLECSAMAKKYLGQTIDIHCGGIDLKFPHHENEIAQSEGANDGKQFCLCWLHNGFVNIGDEKMSKSKGNFLTLRTACPKNDDVRAYRYLVVSSQYRNPLSFTEGVMAAAKGALKRMDAVLKNIDSALYDDGNDNTIIAADNDNNNNNNNNNNDSDIVKTVQKQMANFEAALLDDIAMPRASASLFAIIKAAETEFKRFKKAQKDNDNDDDNPDTTITPLDLVGLKAVKDAMLKMDTVFGIFYDVPSPKATDGTTIDTTQSHDEDDFTVPDDVLQLVQSRIAAKEANDWTLADDLRARVTELGFSIKDVKGGEPIVSRIE